MAHILNALRKRHRLELTANHMQKLLFTVLMIIVTPSALAGFKPQGIPQIKAMAYAAMQRCLGELKPEERELPPTCVFNECSLKVRSCWEEGALVVQEQIDAIEKYVESAHSRDRCDRAFQEYWSFPTPQHYLQLQQQLAQKGDEFEWLLPPKLRGDAAILNRLVTYEIVLKLFNSECR